MSAGVSTYSQSGTLDSGSVPLMSGSSMASSGVVSISSDAGGVEVG